MNEFQVGDTVYCMLIGTLTKTKVIRVRPYEYDVAIGSSTIACSKSSAFATPQEVLSKIPIADNIDSADQLFIRILKGNHPLITPDSIPSSVVDHINSLPND